MAKGTVIKNFVNVKTVDGSAMILPLTMQLEDWVYGDISVTGSDIMNFTYFFRKDGTQVSLPKPCKASAANMLIDPNAVENPEPPVDPTVPPVIDPKSLVTLLYIDTTFRAYDNSLVVIRTIPETS